MMKKGFAIAVLSAALALGTAGITAMAAEGWVQSGSNWSYTNASGNKVTNEWRKGADNQWRFLNAQGVMAINTWAAGDYYVDSNGIMVTDKWMKLAKKNPKWGEENEMAWYYFSSPSLPLSILIPIKYFLILQGFPCFFYTFMI